MAEITYLLGAGASYHSLPIVNKFEEEIRAIVSKIDAYSNFLHLGLPDDEKVVKKTFDIVRSDLYKLLVGCSEHRSVDTYLKKVFLTIKNNEDEESYRHAKCSIILFFELYRFFYNKTDKRYDAFLATILNKSKNGEFVLPSDINILSWNYDYEFERAYMKYIPDRSDIDNVYNDLNILHKNSKEERSIANNFGILKINGTAGFYHQKKIILGLGYSALVHTIGITRNGQHFEDINNIYPLLKSYVEFAYEKANEYVPAISFAWEDGDGMDKVKNEITEALSNTRKLIVIGYSFPYFNREIDALIARSCEMAPQIFIQSPDAMSLTDSVEELDNTIEREFIYTKTNTDQFYMSF